jgi:hypothetical protein
VTGTGARGQALPRPVHMGVCSRVMARGVTGGCLRPLRRDTGLPSGGALDLAASLNYIQS